MQRNSHETFVTELVQKTKAFLMENKNGNTINKAIYSAFQMYINEGEEAVTTRSFLIGYSLFRQAKILNRLMLEYKIDVTKLTDAEYKLPNLVEKIRAIFCDSRTGDNANSFKFYLASSLFVIIESETLQGIINLKKGRFFRVESTIELLKNDSRYNGILIGDKNHQSSILVQIVKEAVLEITNEREIENQKKIEQFKQDMSLFSTELDGGIQAFQIVDSAPTIEQKRK